MKYFLKKQIHSCCASLSSGDAFVTKEVTKDIFDKVKGLDITESEKHGFAVAYLEPDKFFYDKALNGKGILDAPNKEEFQSYVERFCLINSFTEKNDFLDAALSRHWEDENESYTQKRIAEGFVIPEWHKDLRSEDYKGGLSDQVFNDKGLQEYLLEGGCHGYIGHSIRKPELDAFIEQEFLKENNNVELFASWLSSTYGRHFGDSLEGFTFDEQKQKVARDVHRQIQNTLSYFGK